MDSEHILTLAADYSLGLLPSEERRRVETHLRRCPACRIAVERERRVALLVREAARVSGPSPGRLAALRPPLPPVRYSLARLSRQLAPVTLLVVFLALGLLFGSARSPFAPALFAATGAPTVTATYTQTPTATLAAAGVINKAANPATTVAAPARPIMPSPGPARPAATPVAAASP